MLVVISFVARHLFLPVSSFLSSQEPLLIHFLLTCKEHITDTHDRTRPDIITNLGMISNEN